MFVYNLKVNKKGILKGMMLFLGIIVIALVAVVLTHILGDVQQDTNRIDDTIPSSEIATITPENYTNILKEVHNDVDTYVGQKISFTGYVYRVNDFQEDQFVLARDMDVGNQQTVVVGFLCSSEKAKDFENYTWVTLTGEITKGNYHHTEMPIIRVINIEGTNKPANDSVPMPDDSYVPTCVIY